MFFWVVLAGFDGWWLVLDGGVAGFKLARFSQ
jgi:hypothetical protein